MQKLVETFHLFCTQGLAGCPFDAMADEGTRFKVTFWVWDSAAPPANASATRGITLTKACPGTDTPYLCTQKDGTYACSGAQAICCPCC